mmetsp:Transcript_65655/g.183597  ORF Transcript_65655/g.183597 Transcript_65655/m.183597 type:complete len:211 (+) Transcript_65655:1326-1958(+)
MEMPCSTNIWRTVSSQSMDVDLRSSALVTVLAPGSFMYRTLVQREGDHQSNLLMRLVTLSTTSKAPSGGRCTGTTVFGALVFVGVFWACSANSCCFSNRSTSSKRRSFTPALAPCSRTSALKLSSTGSSETCGIWAMLATNLWSKASWELKRSSSLFSRRPSMKARPSSPHRSGTLTVFFRVASSPLKGNRPVMVPNKTTPRAKTSTFNP